MPKSAPIDCPQCNADVRGESWPVYGEFRCPSCGKLLWYLNLPSRSHVFRHSSSDRLHDRTIQIVADQLGIEPERLREDPSLANSLGADSLDTVELVMELEKEFDLHC